MHWPPLVSHDSVSRVWLDALLVPLLLLAGAVSGVRLPALAARRARSKLERLMRHTEPAAGAPSAALQAVHLLCGLLMCGYHTAMVVLCAVAGDDSPSGGTNGTLPGLTAFVYAIGLGATASAADVSHGIETIGGFPPPPQSHGPSGETVRFETGCHAAGLVAWLLISALTLAETSSGCAAGRADRLWCMTAACLGALRCQTAVVHIWRLLQNSSLHGNHTVGPRLLLDAVAFAPALLIGLVSFFEPDTPSNTAYTRPPTQTALHTVLHTGTAVHSTTGGGHSRQPKGAASHSNTAGGYTRLGGSHAYSTGHGAGGGGNVVGGVGGGVGELGASLSSVPEGPALHSPTPQSLRHTEATASYYSRLTFSWLSPLLARGRTTPLEQTDVYELTTEDTAGYNAARLAAAWDREARAGRSSFFRAAHRAFGGYFWASAGYKVCILLLSMTLCSFHIYWVGM